MCIKKDEDRIVRQARGACGMSSPYGSGSVYPLPDRERPDMCDWDEVYNLRDVDNNRKYSEYASRALENQGFGAVLEKKKHIEIASADIEDRKAQKSEELMRIGKQFKEYSYRETLDLAARVTDFYVEKQTYNADFEKEFVKLERKFPECKLLDEQKIKSLTGYFGDLTRDQRNNVIFGGILFFVLTRGEYPQDHWEDVRRNYRDTLIGIAEEHSDKARSALRKAGGNGSCIDFDAPIACYKAERERKDIEKLIPEENELFVGQVKLFEILYDVFVDKYANYNVTIWQKKINEFIGKKYNLVNNPANSVRRDKFELFAVSCEGLLDKPGHHECEDASCAVAFDDNTWLAAAADGVGSCPYSGRGSRLAINKLREVIDRKLKEDGYIEPVADYHRRKKHGALPKWSELMYFFRFELASALYKEWASAIRGTDGESPDNPNDFATTLQFAFGCKAFVVCGKVGDGLMFLSKREIIGERVCDGGRFIDDGISGVTQPEVITVAHLGGNPSALRTDFYVSGEVRDIIIASDGAEYVLGSGVRALKNTTEYLRGLPFEKRRAALESLSKRGADYNETQGGSGDDSTVVHVLLKV